MQLRAPDAPADRGTRTPGEGLAAFVSYSHRDAAYVERLVRALEALGRDVWMDEDDIPPGAPWRTELGTAIEAADAFLYVLSPDSVASPECHAELERAVAIGKRLVAVEHRPVDQPPPQLADIQWIRGGPKDMAQLAADVCHAIDADHDHVRAHTLWLSRALRWDVHGRERSQLLRGRDLDAADEWLTAAQNRSPRPTPVQAEFIAASRRARRRRARRIVAGALAALAFAIVLATVAVVQRNAAERERRTAHARELAASALLTLGEDPELSLILAVRAARIDANEQVADALRQGLLSSRVRATLTGHRQQVRHVAVTPDGSSIATASADRTARLWRGSGGRARAVLRGHQSPLAGLEFGARGRLLLTFAQDGTSRVWDVASGRRVAVLRDSDDPRIQDAALSPDGRLAATAPFVNSRIRIWDVATGRAVTALPQDTINDVEFSPNGRLLLTTDQSHTATLWDVADGRRVQVLTGHRGRYVWGGTFSPDGRLVATVASDRTARLWDVATGEEQTVLLGHRGEVTSVAFSSDGRRLLTTGADRSARVWEVASGRALAELGHDSDVMSAAFSPDGEVVATTDADGIARLWRAGGGRPVATMRGHRGPVEDVAFAPGDRVITAGADGTARIWDGASGSPGVTQLLTQRIGETATLSTPTGRTLLSHADPWSGGGSCHVLAPPIRRRAQPCVHHAGREVIAVSDDGRRIVTAPWADAGRVRLEEARTGRTIAALTAVELGVDVTAGFAADGRVAIGLGTGFAEIWTGNGQRLESIRAADPAPTLLTPTGGLTSVRFSSDGRSLLTASNDRSVRVLDIASGRQRVRIDDFPPQVPRIKPIARAVYSPDNGRIAGYTSWSDTGLIWDAATGRVGAVLRGHLHPLSSAAFSPDGRFVVTTDARDLRLWDAVSGRTLAVVGQAQPYRGPHDAFFLQDRRTIAVVQSHFERDATLKLYACAICGSVASLADLAAGRITRGLSNAERERYLHDAS